MIPIQFHSFLLARRAAILAAPLWALAAFTADSLAALPDGFDAELGGSGTQPGQFADLLDIAFDGRGLLLTLEGQKETRDRDHRYPGNLRVQKIDPATGKPVSSFSLADPEFPQKPVAGHPFGPSHLAGDAQGRVFVTYPGQNLVRQYDPAGHKLADFSIPSANAVVAYPARGPACVAVIGGVHQVVGRAWAHDGGRAITLIDGKKKTVIPLDHEVTQVADMAADRAGNFYVLASLNALYKFSPDGKLLKTLGAQTKIRPNDGSELNTSVEVDAEGNIFVLDDNLLCRFSADLQTVSLREPKYQWFQASNFKAMALDAHGRLWGATTDLTTSPLFERYHFLPVVARLTADFFNPLARGVKSASTRSLGLKASIQPALPFGVAYDLQPFAAELVIAAANRNVRELQVDYHAYDAYRREAGHGQFTLALKDGEEARAPMPFTPPRFGWYTYETTIKTGDQELMRFGQHVGVTPDFPGMVKLTQIEGLGGTADVPKQMFTGLPNMRLNATADPKSLDFLEKVLTACEQYGAVPFVCFADEKDATEASIRAAVTRFKGRVKVWEIINEPNLRMAPEKYISEYLSVAARVIHEVDPAAKVMGPACCGIILPWYEGFYKAGGGKLIDILSLHDYEGHQAIDPIHWRWKLGQLREIIARNGDANKEIWQTERLLDAIRGGDFMPMYQAVNMAQHRDLLETLGIPPDHNNHYYVNQMGYQAVPSYIWGSNGPHAAGFVTRTRYAETLGRKYEGKLDFGPMGNEIFSALRYRGSDGQTIVLRNEGTADQQLVLNVTSGDALHVVDAWGNESTVPVTKGRAEVMVFQLPQYLRLEPKQDISVPAIDFGQNLAELAAFTYSGQTQSPVPLLNNGIIETVHAGNPNGGTDGKKIWTGELPEIDGHIVPQTLEVDFGQPRTFDKIVLHGVRADNAFCTLLDYDLEADSGAGEGTAPPGTTSWKTLASVRSAVPASDAVSLPPTLAIQWNGNENLFVRRLSQPVTARRLRIVARRATFGFSFDQAAADATKKLFGSASKEKLMLREVEVFAPRGALNISVTAGEPRKTAMFATEEAKATFRNISGKPVKRTARFTMPAGWKVEPPGAVVEVAAGGAQSVPIRVTPPPVLSIGSAMLEVTAGSSGDGSATPDLGWLRYDIVAPMELTPGGVREVGSPHQALLAKVRNTGPGALSGTVKLDVDGTLVENPFGPVEPGNTVEVSFAVPSIKLIDAHPVAHYTATANQLQVTATQPLGLRQWNIIGTWEKNLDEKFGPEKYVGHIDPARTYTDMMGNEQKWRIISSEPSGYLNMLSLQPNQNITAYALIYVTTRTARRAIFSAGTDDSGKAWLNGQEVFVDPSVHESAPGQVQKPVELKAGRNEVLYKIVQGKFKMGLHFDLLDAEGKSMTDLTFSPVP